MGSGLVFCLSQASVVGNFTNQQPSSNDWIKRLCRSSFILLMAEPSGSQMRCT